MATARDIIRRRRARKERHQRQARRTTVWASVWLTLVLLGGVVPVGGVVGVTAYAYAEATRDLPTPVETTFLDSVGVTRLLDRTGTVELLALQDPLGSNRTWTTLDSLPQHLIDATLLVEDPDFLQTARFDLLGTGVRLWENIMAGPTDPDPTLTGRLVRNAISAKADAATPAGRRREAALVAEVNRRYTPQEVLEWHLNTNYYGSEAYGIEAAAQVYLGKAAAELTVDEAALLASIPTAPQFNPFDDEAAARGRQADTLRRMRDAGALTPEAYAQAAEVITAIRPGGGQQPALAPDFSFYARRQAEVILDNLGYDGARLMSRGGLTIITTLDVPLYGQAACALSGALGAWGGQAVTWRASDGAPCSAEGRLRALAPLTEGAPDSGSVVILDVANGEILAMEGAGNRPDAQPALTLAPFVVFEGFRDRQQGTQYTPASMVLDIPRSFPGAAEGLIYQPANLDGSFSGPLTVREAAAKLLIPPVVQMADNHGLTGILRTARRLGITTLNDGLYDLSLLERGGAVAPLDIAYAYGVLSAQGEMFGVPVPPRGVGLRNRDPVAVLQITDAQGEVLWQHDPAQTRVNVFRDAPELGYLVNNVFADGGLRLERFGSGSPLVTDRPAAVVESLSSDRRDHWAVGYTPQRVVAVHLSRADDAPLGTRAYLDDGAAGVWRAVIDAAHGGLPADGWPRPANVVELTVCQRSGLLPHPDCPTRREVFIAGIQPTQPDTFWQAFEINSQTRQLATSATAQALRVRETYFVPPDAALDWWRANRQPLPPTDYDTFSRPEDAPFQTTVLSRPEPLALLRGTTEVRGSVAADDLRYYQLSYGAGVNPSEWSTIGGQQATAPSDGLLGTWDTTGLDGIYTLELAAVKTDNTRERSVVQVRIDNTPPTVVISAEGGANKVYRFPTDQTIPLSIAAADNLALDRVEVYHEGRLVATLRQAPYAYTHPITAIGDETFTAVAYDLAGSRSETAPLVVSVTR
ncbi:MAG: penicillin-binding protein [Anaerolineae bacterium]|nr:penicillin-binding protein [Anaerolineae bacterium]